MNEGEPAGTDVVPDTKTALCIGAILIGLMGATFGLTEWDSVRQRAEAATNSVADSTPPGLGDHFTKSSFDREVSGKTKDQIKAEFGKPGLVHDNSDEWVYYEIPIYDDTAGTKVMWASIRFEGTNGGDDRAVDVSFD